MPHVAADGDGDARERGVAGQYARRFEPWVMGYPGQWFGCRGRTPRVPPLTLAQPDA